MPSKAAIALGLLINFVSSVSVVGVNKYLYVHYGFPNITLTCIHFVVTFMGLLVCQGLGMFKRKTLPLRDMSLVAFTFSCFVVFANLSLQFNTVGTYQMIKTMTVPFIMFVETLFYGKHFSWPIRLTFIPIFLGVVANSYYDVRFNILGTIVAGLGIVTAAMYQIFVGTKQTSLGANSMQLLYYQAPLSVAILCFVIPVTEPVIQKGGVFSNQWSLEALSVVFLSGAIAFSVNLSIYWVIGKTSPLTYNMFGHLKFCGALVVGYVIFEDPINLNQFIGMLITLSGVITYSILKMRPVQSNSLPK